MIVEIALAGAVYVAYREYKSGKLKNIVTEVEKRIASLEAAAKYEAAKISVTSVVSEVKAAETEVAKVL